MDAPAIKITRTYTLPTTREGGGRPRTEELTYDPADYRTPVEWAAEELSNAGITRHNWGAEFITEEPKITSYATGEQMTATAALSGFTADQMRDVVTALENWQRGVPTVVAPKGERVDVRELEPGDVFVTRCAWTVRAINGLTLTVVSNHGQEVTQTVTEGTKVLRTRRAADNAQESM